MYFVAGVLVVLAGLFYAAGQQQLGSSRFRDVPVRRGVLRQSGLRPGRRRARRRMGRIRERAIASTGHQTTAHAGASLAVATALELPLDHRSQLGR